MSIEPRLAPPIGQWQQLCAVLDGPLPEIAVRFSRFLAPTDAHEALIIFTRECTGRPRKVAGTPDIVERATIDELDQIKNTVGVGEVSELDAVLGGASRPIRAVRDASDTLLVLVPKRSRSGTGTSKELLAAWFAIVAVSIRQQVAQASPDYLAESRAASSERARTIAQLTEAHEDTLASVLGTLRSRDLDDRTARSTAAETASSALITLRAVGDTDRKLATEAVTTAFRRLQAELEPALRHLAADVDYVGPSVDGSPLPGEIAHGARAIVRAAAVAVAAQPGLARVRIEWDSSGDDLVVDIRDQGPGELDGELLARQLAGRLQALNGELEVESIPGWGTRVSARIPLAASAARPDEDRLSALNPREVEVLGHLALGRRNKAIAAALGVSESTVKFHVTAILQKLKVSNRGEAGLLAASAGIVAE
ncbi:LuxR C-terminal-related transcriptional regulator [Gordonia sp. VNQ95]|uniref:helix-turn-helix transcriptional regulator n=1 Tax=Gordonia sp. VNQ95 TaxID=3156619 RepID=UPI0032B47C16